MPLIYLSLGWLLGIWGASILMLPPEVLLLAALIPLIGLALWWIERRVRLIWLAAFFAVLGGLRYQIGGCPGQNPVRHLYTLPNYPPSTMVSPLLDQLSIL